MKQVLFMILEGDVKFLTSDTMDHREWYNSLGKDPNLFDEVIRGFILNNKIVYYKGSTFRYDDEVIKAAKMYTPYIRHSMNNPTLEACCGVTFTSPTEWEVVVKIQENEITGIASTPKEEVKQDTGPSFHIENNVQDEQFRKNAMIVTGVVIALSLISKIFLLQKQEILSLSHFFDLFLIVAQFALLGFSIYLYAKKKEIAKYTSIAASVVLILTFHIVDVILGILYFLFCVNQNIFISIINKIKGKKSS